METEITNKGALRLYERLGFIRQKRLPKYYLNGNDAYRLKLWIPSKETPPEEEEKNGGEQEAVVVVEEEQEPVLLVD